MNSILTIKGGTHVSHVTDQVTKAVIASLTKKRGAGAGMNIKTHHVKNYLWVFVNCLIENPAFDSQTKETLTLVQKKFGSKCVVTESVIKRSKC